MHNEYFRVKDGRLLYRSGTDLGSCYQEVDGYYVWVPEGNGAWDTYSLRLIANFLEEINKEWDEEIKEYFKNNS